MRCVNYDACYEAAQEVLAKEDPSLTKVDHPRTYE